MKNKPATLMNLKPASLGSISTGTLRTEDLLSAFADILESLILVNGAYFSLPENRAERDRLGELHGEALDLLQNDKTYFDEAPELISNLSDALGMFAPAYCYFGAQEGDGADFGFWPAHDSIEELPLVNGSDEARELGEDCKFVNDHGNVTVYGADGSVLLELV